MDFRLGLHGLATAVLVAPGVAPGVPTKVRVTRSKMDAFVAIRAHREYAREGVAQAVCSPRGRRAAVKPGS